MSPLLFVTASLEWALLPAGIVSTHQPEPVQQEEASPIADGEDADRQGAEGQQADGQNASSSQAPSLVLDMPLSVDGKYARDIAVGVDQAGNAFLREDQLLDVLTAYTAPEFLEAVGLADTDTLRPLSDYEGRGLTITYDQAALAVGVQLPPDSRLTRSLSLSGGGGGVPDSEDLLEPSSFSAGFNLAVTPSYVHEGGEKGFAPLTGRGEGFIAIGGFGGPILAFDGTYTADADDPVVMNDILLFKDIFDKAIRIAGGTVRTRTNNRFDASQSLLGIGVFRNYNEIRPFENLRPAGATSFELERDALVSVLVNGSPVLTERFQAGTYDIEDLPLTAGGNDVTILVEGEDFSEQVAVFSTYVDATLLKAGLTRFGLHAGMIRERGGFLPEASGVFGTASNIEHAVTDQFTIGASLQSLDENYQLATRAVVGTKIGIFAAEAAFQDDHDGSAASGAVRWTWQSDPSKGLSHQFDVQALYEARGFVPLTVGPTLPTRSDPRFASTTLRYSLQTGPTSVSLTGRATQIGDLRSASAVFGLSHAFGTVAASLNARMTWQDSPLADTDHETALLFSLTRRLGRRGRARVSYDTEGRTTEGQFLKLGTPFVGEWDGRLLVTDDERGERLDVEAGYVANRFEASLSHAASRIDDRERAVTSGRAEVGFGLADGSFGWGRPFTSGFVVVKAHESLEDRPVTLTRGDDLVEARTSFLGPALQPLRSPYRGEQTRVSVDDLPVGYDLGPDLVEVFSPARAGYAHTVGKGASNTVMATLIKPDGSPMSLAIGQLVRVDGDEEPVQFFTNRTGRFVGEGLRPGTYSVLMKPDDRKVAEIEIADDAEGLVRIGSVQMEED